MKIFAPLVVALACGAALSSQQTFRGGTDTVLLSVTVTNDRRQHVPGLTQEDFLIFEDGVRQSIGVFASDPQPIALSLLIDASISMEHKLSVAQDAAIGFIRRLRPNDVAQIVAFSKDIDFRQTFTNDAAALERAVRGIQLRGSTALYQAVYIALSDFKTLRTPADEPLRRRAIVVLSDGEDTGSLVGADDVIDAAKRMDVMVYAIAVPDRDRSNNNDLQGSNYGLRMLSQVTGGRLFAAAEIAELPAIYGQIADELANQYVIGYTSKNLRRDGAWRLIAIRVDEPNTLARTKSGYFAPRQARDVVR